jgi:hypothetical protein
MNERDEELARSIDPEAWRKIHKDDEDWCQQFADLIRADEREACALVCINIANKPSNVILGVAINCATAIRARGQA